VGNNIIDLYLAYYNYPSKNKELVNSGNRLFDLKQYKLLKKTPRQIIIEDYEINFDEFQLTVGNKKQIIWGWYTVFGQSLTKEIKIKLLQAAGKLSGVAVDGSYIAISTQYNEIEQAREQLHHFLSNHWVQIKNELD